MRRIRTIRPELIQCDRVARLTDPAARLFLSCYTLADDAGNCQAGPRYLNGQIFFERPRGPTAIGRLLGELEALRLVDRYTIDRAPYLAIIGWSEKDAPTYQRIEKYKRTVFPPPEAVRSWNDVPDKSRTDLDREMEMEMEGKGARAREGARGNDAATPRMSSGPLIEFFSESYARAYGGSAPTWSQRNRKLLAELELEHGNDEVRRRIANMFGDTERSFPKPPYDLATLVTHFDKFAKASGRARIEAFTDDDYTRPVEGLPMFVPGTNGVGRARDFDGEEDF